MTIEYTTPPKPDTINLRIDSIPKDLQNKNRWILWRYELRTTSKGAQKWAKVPKNIRGGPASSTDPATWSSFDDAVDAYIDSGDRFEGVGFVLDASDGVVGVDLDDHRDPATGELDQLAKSAVESMHGYWEVSPSGTGVKGLVFAPSSVDSQADHKSGIEIYTSGRYFAITGHALRSDIGPDQGQQLKEFLSQHVGQVKEASTRSSRVGPSAADMDPDALDFFEQAEHPVVRGWDLQRVVDEVLPHLDGSAYQDWIRVGQVLHHQCNGSQEALQEWDMWSREFAGFQEGACSDKWDTFGLSGRVTTLAGLLSETRDQREKVEQEKRDQKRQERSEHVKTLVERVLGCGDVESLKDVVAVVREDTTIDDTDRNGSLTVAVQQRFKDLGSPQKRDDVRKMLKPTGGWSADSGSPSGPEWLSRWVYVKSEGVFFSLDRKAALDSRAFDAEHTDKMPLRNGTISLRERASEYAVHAWAIRTVDRTIYAPPEGEIFEQDKATYVNLYDPDSAPACEPGGEAAVRMVMSHLERMLPDQRERELFLSWMAHVVRHPGKKVRWAPYIYGVEGAGKSFLADLLEWVMGAPNIRRVAGRDLVSDFTGWAAGRALTVVEEAHQTGHRYDVGEVLKAPVTNDRISVHKKGVDPYEIVNYVSYLVLSNHADGIPITETDRRYFFLQSAIGTEAARALSEEGFYNNLFAVCKASRGQLRRWLIEDVKMHPEFDPNGRAPVTEARARVIELTKTDAQAAVEELLAGRKAVTSSHVHAHLESLGTDIRTSRLGNLIGSAGFVFFKKMRIGEGTSRVWVRPGEIRGGDESEVRNALSWCLSDDF
jgi:hypothetical protein